MSRGRDGLVPKCPVTFSIPQYNNSFSICIPSFKNLALIVHEKNVTQKALRELRVNPV